MTTVETTHLRPDHPISRVIKGGWQLAGDHGEVDRHAAVRDMEAFLDAGITTFDCADIYVGVEEMIGDFVADIRQRRGAAVADQVRVHTKLVPDLGRLADLRADEVEKLDVFHRYYDHDGDAIPQRTLPGDHPKGAYFTRGSGHNMYGAYTENAGEYQEVVDRLSRNAPMSLKGGGTSADGVHCWSTWSTPMVWEMTVRRSHPGHNESAASSSAVRRDDNRS